MDAGERPSKGPVLVREFIILLSSGTFAAGLFGYLRYRNYSKLARHVVDKLGVDGLKALDHVAPPSGPAQALTRRMQLPRRQPHCRGGGTRAT